MPTAQDALATVPVRAGWTWRRVASYGGGGIRRQERVGRGGMRPRTAAAAKGLRRREMAEGCIQWSGACKLQAGGDRWEQCIPEQSQIGDILVTLK